MERIGIAASKMAKGNLIWYNLYVLVISFLFSLLIFISAGSAVVVAIIIIAHIVNGIFPQLKWQDWFPVIRLCMVFLAIIVSLLNLCAILKNIKLTK